MPTVRPASRCWSAAASVPRRSSQDHQAVRARPRYLSYVEAILRVYNQYGRRDSIYKARIKILVHELGIEFAREVEEVAADARQRALTRHLRRRNPFALFLSGLQLPHMHYRTS
jgi:sulfite reductase beta subunit-like hemoprotein